MRRAPEVIDTWFDSGSMSFAQWHYPFENRDKIADQFPADFIAEGVDQTRGWFYSLLAIATGLGDALPNNAGPSGGANTFADVASPYRAVVVNDQVLDAEGKKMSKSVGNVVDPWEVMSRHGADAARLFFVASSAVWVPRSFDEKLLAEQAGRFLRTLKNVYSGIFAQYANFGWNPSEADPPLEARPALDRWMISRLARLEQTVDAALGAYDATAASRAIIEFVDDDVANWYVRLSRGRFYDVEGDDNRAAFATLHEVLVVGVPAPRADRAVRERLDSPGADGRIGSPRAVCRAARSRSRPISTRRWRRSARSPGSAVRPGKRSASRCAVRLPAWSASRPACRNRP